MTFHKNQIKKLLLSLGLFILLASSLIYFYRLTGCHTISKPPVGLCYSSRWCWVSPLSQGDLIVDAAWDGGTPINKLWLISRGSINRTSILYKNETIWTVSYETSVRLNSIYFSAINDGWAVGEEGTILHWDGKKWTNIYSPSSKAINAIFAFSSRDAWAVGKAILHWDGSQWSQSGTSEFVLRSLWGSNPSNIWAVGDDGNFLHWDGQTWLQLETPPADVTLRKVHGNSANNIWAVGDRGGIFRFNGRIWLQAPTPFINQSSTDGEGYTNIKTVYLDQKSQVWLSTQDGIIYRFDGQSWEKKYENISANRIVFNTFIKGWPCLDCIITAGQFGSIMSFDGAEWNRLDQTLLNSEITAMGGTKNDNLWFMGVDGKILNWDGVVWRQHQLETISEMSLIWVNNERDVWVAEKVGRLRHWNGAAWTDQESPFFDHVTSIFSSGGSLWVAAKQQIWRYQDNIWHKIDAVEGSGIWGSSSNSVWVAGEKGVFRYSGSKWIQSSPIAATSIGGYSNNFIWAFTTSSLAIWDGKQWYPITSPSEAISNVWGKNLNNIWVTAEGQLQHWDGIQWNKTNIGQMYTVFGTSNGIWAAGSNGMIMYNPIK